jgi:uncharacterized protein (UPF0332 family)
VPLKLKDFIVWADVLAKASQNKTGTELMSRDAIKHAYYGCYHLALQWAKIRGYQFPSDGGMHTCLWNRWYKNDKPTKAIGRRGLALHQKRIDADYEIQSVLAHDPIAAIQEARELIDLLEKDMDRIQKQKAEPVQRTVGLGPGKPPTTTPAKK